VAEQPPTRRRLFALGALGFLPAILVALVADAAVQGDGKVANGFFIAVAAITPVLGLGLLVQLVTALTRRTRDLMREVQRFDQEMSAEPPRLIGESHDQRKETWQVTTLFRHAVVPFGGGVALQLLATEVVAIVCLVVGAEDRLPAVALGLEVVVLFAYLLFFNAALRRATAGRIAAPPPAGRG
jgi:hypothetical protein